MLYPELRLLVFVDCPSKSIWNNYELLKNQLATLSVTKELSLPIRLGMCLKGLKRDLPILVFLH